MAIIVDLNAVKYAREPSFMAGQKEEADMALDALRDHFSDALRMSDEEFAETLEALKALHDVTQQSPRRT